MSAGRILVLCTGNICRSPYIEHLLRAELAGTGVVVVSAGTAAVVGSAMHPEALRRLAALGIDGSLFRARQVTAELLSNADLIIGATREHVASVGWLSRDAFDRTHSLGDLAHALGHGRALPPHAGLEALARVAASERSAGRMAREQHTVDVIDPYQQSAAVWARMAETVGAHLPVLVSALRT